jgi:ABC transport system ATP-binding/permease protein
VLAELELTGQGGQRIDTLSGGQRKRTSVALELLTTPSLLFLDEPTSGLDPGLDRSVMQTLRGLSDGGGGRGGTRPAGGRTVVVVTHSVLNLDMCDLLLVLAPGGHLAYFGPPREALRYFGQPDFSEMFLLLGGSPGRSWPPATGRPRNISATSPHPRRRCRACRTAPRCRAPRRASSRCSPSSPC